VDPTKAVQILKEALKYNGSESNPGNQQVCANNLQLKLFFTLVCALEQGGGHVRFMLQKINCAIILTIFLLSSWTRCLALIVTKPFSTCEAVFKWKSLETRS